MQTFDYTVTIKRLEAKDAEYVLEDIQATIEEMGYDVTVGKPMENKE